MITLEIKIWNVCYLLGNWIILNCKPFSLHYLCFEDIEKYTKRMANEVIKNDLITDQGLNIEHGLIDL